MWVSLCSMSTLSRIQQVDQKCTSALFVGSKEQIEATWENMLRIFTFQELYHTNANFAEKLSVPEMPLITTFQRCIELFKYLNNILLWCRWSAKLRSLHPKVTWKWTQGSAVHNLWKEFQWQQQCSEACGKYSLSWLICLHL